MTPEIKQGLERKRNAAIRAALSSIADAMCSSVPTDDLVRAQKEVNIAVMCNAALEPDETALALERS